MNNRRKNTPRAPKQGDLRVYNIVNVPGTPVLYPVASPAHAFTLITALAQSQLLQPEVESNVFGLEVYEDGEWCEWYDEEGRDIDEWAEDSLEKTVGQSAIMPISFEVAALRMCGFTKPSVTATVKDEQAVNNPPLPPSVTGGPHGL